MCIRDSSQNATTGQRYRTARRSIAESTGRTLEFVPRCGSAGGAGMRGALDPSTQIALSGPCRHYPSHTEVAHRPGDCDALK